MRILSQPDDSVLVHEIETLSGQNLFACYQCGKCTAGCPVGEVMEIPPHQVIRLLQIGQPGRALAAQTIWTCAACLTCAARCPKDVDLARIMEALRTIALRRGDRLLPSAVEPIPLGEVPQMAVIAGFRKWSS
jgi:heterodisulfide reductase subunit C